MPSGLKRTVRFSPGSVAEVGLSNPLARYPGNPILTPRDVNRQWDLPSLSTVTAHNAAVVRHDNQTIMLFRSHLRTGMSVIGLARSTSGIDHWEIAPRPVILPATLQDTFAEDSARQSIVEHEAGGVEDPRIVRMGDTYAITYSAYHGRVKNRVRVSLITTSDFRTFVRHGPMLERDMRNVVLFSEPIEGEYAGLFRPNDGRTGDLGGEYTQIRLGRTLDWRTGPWRMELTPVMRTGGGPSAFSDKIGPGAPPIKIPHGWLSIFHGVRTTMAGNPYVLGVALHALDNPASVRMSAMPILFPTAADCRVAADDYVHVPQVVFSCGAVRGDDGSILVYYGGNDTVMNVGITHEDVLIEMCERFGQDPLTGERLYRLW
jgi:predicted GH43/DUF377 family glycosyl hydrolase